MFGRKQKETWWENTGREQNAASEGPAEVVEAAADDQPEDPAPSGKPKKSKGRRKHRWDWWDAAGGLLEVILDFVTDLFD